MANLAILSQYSEYMHGRVRDSTLQAYIYSIRQLLLSMNGSSLTPEFAQKYVDSLAKTDLSPNTIALRAHAIMSFFRWKNVKVQLDLPSITYKKPEYLKIEQIEEAIGACRTQLEKTIIVMLYDTAVRISELLNLEVDNIDWESKTITVIRKGGRETDVNVSDKALKELKAWMNMRQSNSKKVFLDLDYYTTWSMVKDIGRKVGIPNMHPHIFRHSRAIHLLKAGVKPFVVQQHLGHKSISTTLDIYGMFLAADLRGEIPEW